MELIKLNEKTGVPAFTAAFDAYKQAVGCEGLSDAELSVIAYQCNRTGLSLLDKHIYAIKRQGKLTIQIGIDGMLLLAERSGKYEGLTQAEWCDAQGNWFDVWTKEGYPFACKIGVYRKGFPQPIYAVALWSEYAQSFPDKYNGNKPKLGDMWAKMPARMLEKSATVAALRKGFPMELSGLATSHDAPQEQQVDDIPHEDLSKPELADADTLNDFELKAESMVALQLMTEAKMTESLAWAKTAAKTTVEAQMAKWDKEIKANHDKALAEKGGSE